MRHVLIIQEDASVEEVIDVDILVLLLRVVVVVTNCKWRCNCFVLNISNSMFVGRLR
jgi:hypothetical protein